MTKNWNRWACVAICVALLCGILAGCRAGNPPTTGKPATQPTGSSPSTAPTQPTKPTEPTKPTVPEIPDDGIRAVQLITEGGFPIVDTHIAVYADEALSQHLATIHTDSNGAATYVGEPGGTYYMVPANSNATSGFVSEPYYTVTEAFTTLIVKIKLIGYEYRAGLGKVMCEINAEDWNKNQFVLSQCIEQGKPCIIWCINIDSDKHEQQMTFLQQFYAKYSDQLELVLYVGRGYEYFVRQLLDECGMTFPIISSGQYDPDWMTMSDLLVIDRYGLVALEDYTILVDAETMEAIGSYFADKNYRQDRTFANCRELRDYMESLQAGEEVTYQVKVVDRNGTPQSNIRLEVSYAYRTFGVTTDEQGIASWVLYLRDDIEVEFNRNEYDRRIYIMENEGLFEPGVTEKTLVMQERDKVSYTVKVVDTAGNPVFPMGIRIHPYEKMLWADENGVIQWESVEMDEPFTADEIVPDGYLYGGITREGNVFTVLMYPIVTYYIKLVDENGNPVDSVWVDFYEEGNEEKIAYGLTHTDGVAMVDARAGKFYIKLYDREYIDGAWYEYRYGTFELEEGVTEYTFVVGEPETVKS